MEIVVCLFLFLLILALIAIMLKHEEMVEQLKISNNLKIDAKQGVDSMLENILADLKLQPKGDMTYAEYMEKKLNAFYSRDNREKYNKSVTEIDMTDLDEKKPANEPKAENSIKQAIFDGAERSNGNGR